MTLDGLVALLDELDPHGEIEKDIVVDVGKTLTVTGARIVNGQIVLEVGGFR